MHLHALTDKQRYIFIWILAIIGSLLFIPYAQHIGLYQSEISFSSILIVGLIQAAIIYGLICFACYKMIPKAGIHPFPHSTYKHMLIVGGVAGLVIGIALYLLAHFMPYPISEMMRAPIWVGLLSCFYRAFNEEILCRLFLLTLIFFVTMKIFKGAEHHRTIFFWVANVLAAFIFATAHLPILYAVMQSPSTLEILYMLFLSGVAGVAFGWLFWTHGLWVAIIAHFVAAIIFNTGVLGILP